jgi:hypothetical protein
MLRIERHEIIAILRVFERIEADGYFRALLNFMYDSERRHREIMSLKRQIARMRAANRRAKKPKKRRRRAN